jgi:hypothetical protein
MENCLTLDVEDSPRGLLKQLGNPHLKPATKPNTPYLTMQDMAHATKAPAAHQAAHSKTPSNKVSPRSRVRSSLGRIPPRSRGCAPPLARSASLEGPPRPRTGSASLEGAPHACACSRAQALNALTSAGQRHHALGARAPMPPHRIPRREPIPITVGGGLCGATGASPVTPCTCYGMANAPNPRRGAGCILDLLSCDFAGLGGGARPVGRHPCHC